MFYSKLSQRRKYNLESKNSTAMRTEKPFEKTKILLPPSWSGLITVDDSSSQEVKKKYNFSMGLWNIDSKSQFRGVIFRNAQPIQDIHPYKPFMANKDALQSLKSLDNRLQREIQGSPLPDILDEDIDAEYAKDNNIYSSRSTYRRSDADRQENTTRNVVRDFDVTMVSPRPVDDDGELTTVRNGEISLYRQASESTISSLKLNLDDLNSSRFSGMNFSRPLSHQTTPSMGTEFSDALSLVSSTGSLMFTSRQSRLEAYDAIKSPRYAEEQLTEVSKLVRKLSDVEGRKRNQNFQSIFQKLCDVVNSVIDNIPSNILPFNIKKIDKSGNYETNGEHCFEFYISPEISKRDYEVNFKPTVSSLADVFLTGSNPNLELFGVDDPLTKRRKLSPCKLMIVFAHIVNATAKDSDVDGVVFPHDAHVLFESITEKEIRISVKFPNIDIRYEINFILAIDVDDFPLDAVLKKNREWPNASVKHRIASKGVHLTSKTCGSELHSWSVAFLKSRRTLLQLTDDTGNKLRLLLALQCLRETGLSSPDLILPSHFATILFWANVKYRAPIEWSTLKLGRRFIDLVVALRRCLWKHECLDFFVPNVNMFKDMDIEDCHLLSLKIDMLIKDPVSYLKMRVL